MKLAKRFDLPQGHSAKNQLYSEVKGAQKRYTSSLLKIRFDEIGNQNHVAKCGESNVEE